MDPVFPNNSIIEPAPLCEAGNDSILARLDREHLLAHEKAIRLAEASLEASGGCITTLPDDWQPADYVQTYAAELAEKASHAAFLDFEAIGNAAASFTAKTLEGLTAKTRILARQAQCMPLHEIIEKTVELKRLAVSILADMLEMAPNI